MTKQREITIKYVLPNLRYRWPELKAIEDNPLASLYEDFYFSDDAGNNDAKFPKWANEEFNISIKED